MQQRTNGAGGRIRIRTERLAGDGTGGVESVGEHGEQWCAIVIAGAIVCLRECVRVV